MLHQRVLLIGDAIRQTRDIELPPKGPDYHDPRTDRETRPTNTTKDHHTRRRPAPANQDTKDKPGHQGKTRTSKTKEQPRTTRTRPRTTRTRPRTTRPRQQPLDFCTTITTTILRMYILFTVAKTLRSDAFFGQPCQFLSKQSLLRKRGLVRILLARSFRPLDDNRFCAASSVRKPSGRSHRALDNRGSSAAVLQPSSEEHARHNP